MHYISKLLTKCLEEQHLKIIRSNSTFNQQKLISLGVLSSFIEAEVFITKLNLEGFEKSILINLFQEILQTSKEDALFAIYLYNKNIDTGHQR